MQLLIICFDLFLQESITNWRVFPAPRQVPDLKPLDRSYMVFVYYMSQWAKPRIHIIENALSPNRTEKKQCSQQSHGCQRIQHRHDHQKRKCAGKKQHLQDREKWYTGQQKNSAMLIINNSYLCLIDVSCHCLQATLKALSTICACQDDR